MDEKKSKWEERHYKIAEEVDKMFKSGKEGKKIDI